MVTKSELAFESIAGLQQMFQESVCEPEDLLESILENVRRHESKIHAYLHLVSETNLREQARTASYDIKKGTNKPLTGMFLAVKDNTDVAGLPCTGGSKIFEGRIPVKDSNIIRRLRADGAIFLGKTNLDELAAFGIATDNPHYGRTYNPWDLRRIPGGSSGGSAAAVSAGEAVAATGSDTGGSVRVPASFCNLVGLKPTFGLIGRTGTFSMCWSLDNLGFVTRTVRDSALLLESTSGYDPQDALSIETKPVSFAFERSTQDLGTMKIGVFANPIRGSSEGVREAFEKALSIFSELGAKLTKISLPNVDQITPTIFAIALPEVAAYHEEWIRSKRELYGDTLRGYVQLGHAISATSYLKALRAKKIITEKISEKLSDVDLLLVPTAPTIALGLEEEKISIEGRDYPAFQVLTENTYPFNLLGLPAMSIPCGFSNGMPVGLQLVSSHWREDKVFAAGDAFQQVTDYHKKKPNLV